MKKFKKMLAGLLGAAMVLTSFGTPVWAAGADKMPTIDTKRQGSLTIYKYEYNPAEGTATLKDGTGEATDATNVPTDAEPLAGVEFTIYKIADISQTTTNNTIKLVYTPVEGIENLDLSAATKWDDVSSAVDDAIDSGKLKAATPAKKTEISKEGAKNVAKVTFSNLALGLYAVKETGAPSQVVTKTANFLVSIPMTNTVKDESGKPVAGDNWIYDVVAYPKNETVYGGVTLHKTGTTINADGTRETPKNLEGVEFFLQRSTSVIDDEKTIDNVEWPEFPTNDEEINAGLHTTDKDGLIKVDGLAPGYYRFIEYDRGDNAAGFIMDSAKEWKFTVNNDSSITIGTKKYNEGETAVINVDNEQPKLEKKVKKVDKFEDASDASVGDMVEWRVSAAVPSNVDQLKTYKITDEMSKALTYIIAKDDFEIITKNSKGNVTIDWSADDYTLTKPADGTEGGTWTLLFNEAGKKKLKDNGVDSIEITFKTKLNDNAVVGQEGNLNEAILDYSNAIYPTNDPTKPNNGNKPGEDKYHDEAIIFAFKINVNKVDGKDKTTKLDGVVFDLYKYTGTKNNPTEADLKDTKDSTFIKTLTTANGGQAAMERLSNGKYYLVETKTVNGYNLLHSPVEVKIDVKYSVSKDVTTKKDENGNVISSKITTKTVTGGDTGSAGTYTMTIENRHGFELPKTGDIGTAMFLIIGIGGMLAAVYIMLRGRKRA